MNPQAAARILVWDKIRNVFSDEVENEFTRGEIIALVVEDTPNTNRTNVIPSWLLLQHDQQRDKLPEPCF